MGLNRTQKTILHVAKGKLGLTDLEYRAALEAHAGVSSAADPLFGPEAYKAVMEHFKQCGFRPKGGNPPKGRRRGMATEGQIKKIYASWWALPSYYEKGKERKALRGFLKKRWHVEHENFLTFRQAHEVIEAIKAIGRRPVDVARKV